jgi:putative Holliday junction resolvase
MRTGRRVAFDVGKARVGVAISDLHAIIATPNDFFLRTDAILQAVDLVATSEAIEVYVGLPLNLKSEFTESTRDCLVFAEQLQQLLAIDVRMVDERFTTSIASGSLRESGKSSKSQRGLIDSAAAAVILESALESERATGLPPGSKVLEIDCEE